MACTINAFPKCQNFCSLADNREPHDGGQPHWGGAGGGDRGVPPVRDWAEGGHHPHTGTSIHQEPSLRLWNLCKPLFEALDNRRGEWWGHFFLPTPTYTYSQELCDCWMIFLSIVLVSSVLSAGAAAWQVKCFLSPGLVLWLLWVLWTTGAASRGSRLGKLLLCVLALLAEFCSCIIPSAELTPSRPGANMHKQIWFIGSYGQRWNIFDKHIVSALKALSIPL